MNKRQVIEVKGTSHYNPIPTAVKIGNMVYSSAIKGNDPKTGEIPNNIQEEVKNIFNYIKEIMQHANGSIEDIAHFKISVVNRSYKNNINKEWLKMFPDETNRPARHSSIQNLNGNLRVQIEIVAIL